MKMFLLTTTQDSDNGPIDLLIGHSATPEYNEKHQPYMTIGAFRPGKDGNYYNQICFGFNQTGPNNFVEWWDWVKQAIRDDEVKMDSDFEFDLDDVRLIETEIPIK